MDYRMMRLLISLLAVVALGGGALLAGLSRPPHELLAAVFVGALPGAIQNLMQQLSAEQAATSAKVAADKVDRVVETARTEAHMEAAQTTRDVLEKSLPRPEKDEMIVKDGRTHG